MEDGVSIVPVAGTSIFYRFVGVGGGDSLAIDVDGNVYQAIIFHGRF
jgi:hypothetical protein